MQANSQRYGTAASLLPTIHWVLLAALSCLVLVAFVLFDSDFEVSVAENRTIFAVVAAMLCTILLVRPHHLYVCIDSGVVDAMDHVGSIWLLLGAHHCCLP